MEFWVRHFPHPLVADLGEQELEQLCFGTGHALDKPPQSLSTGDVSEVVLAVGGGEFQAVTICHRLKSFPSETAPSACSSIFWLAKNLSEAHDREKPEFRLLAVESTDFAIPENGGDDFHSDGDSTEELSVQRAKLDGFENIVGTDLHRTCQVCKCPGDFQDPVMGAGGEVHFLHRAFEIASAFRAELTILSDQA